jgi:hypothetical protein
VILIVFGESTSYQAPHYAAFFHLLSLHLSSVQIFSTFFYERGGREGDLPNVVVAKVQFLLRIAQNPASVLGPEFGSMNVFSSSSKLRADISN